MSSTEEPTTPAKETETTKEEVAPKQEEAEAPKEEAAAVAPTKEAAAATASKDEEEDASMKDFKTLVHETKVDGGKSVWAMTLETFGMADGSKSKKDDVRAETEEEAMGSIKSMLAGCKEDSPKWQFTLTPLDALNATLDDILRAFVLWSKKDDETTYNVTRAFARLEMYATWMEDHREALETPLTVDSVTIAAHAWQCKATHDAKGHLIWWVDIGAIDIPAIKGSILYSESLRYFVWLSHVIMLDKQAQKNGILVVEGMGNKGLIATMTMVPMELGTQLDRLTIGILPIKMKAFYIFNHKRWLSVLMGMMKPFMSKKMRQRMIVINQKQDPQKILDEELGRDCIPIGFAGLEGKLEDDIIFGNHIK